MRTSISATGKENWREVIAHRDDVFLGGSELFGDFLVVSERQNGLMGMRIIPWDGSGGHDLDFGEAVYDVSSATTTSSARRSCALNTRR